jgi:predicted nucleotidyltransferase
MEICAIICEFNPFHNGHKYLIEQAKALSGCDAVLCIMSGNFTQRGEMALADKFTRARHAVMGGADVVIELPAPFAVAPAEIFAGGAIKILSSIPAVTHLCFGCEQTTDFMQIAKTLTEENDIFKSKLAGFLDGGESYAKSYSLAVAACGVGSNVLQTPNNILAVEYAKAILTQKANIKLVPVQRVGGGYLSKELGDTFSSASAIRENLNNKDVAKFLPDYVYRDVCNAENHEKDFERIVKYALVCADTKRLKCTYGCGEGLENKLKSLQGNTFEEIITGATSKRYSSSRIRRILLCNALGIFEKDSKKFLSEGLYIKPLAVNSQKKEEMLSALSKSAMPVVIKGNDVKELTGSARQCFDLDVLSQQIRDVINQKQTYNNTILTV